MAVIAPLACNRLAMPLMTTIICARAVFFPTVAEGPFVVGLVAVARARSGALAAVAGRPGLKILADSLGLIHRLYGVRDKDGWAIFVVADDGRLIWKDRRPNLALAGWWAGLVAAVRRGAPTVAR